MKAIITAWDSVNPAIRHFIEGAIAVFIAGGCDAEVHSLQAMSVPANSLDALAVAIVVGMLLAAEKAVRDWGTAPAAPPVPVPPVRPPTNN